MKLVNINTFHFAIAKSNILCELLDLEDDSNIWIDPAITSLFMLQLFSPKTNRLWN